MCQKIKNRTEAPVGKLNLSEVLEKLWIHLIVDFITKLPLVVGKDTILVVCNRLLKMIYFVAITEDMSAEGLVWLFRDNGKLYGFPESVISDSRLQFVVELTKELNKMLGIEMKLSTSFNP